MKPTGFLALLMPICAFAQLAPPNPAGVSFGHVHFITQDMEAHRRFWTMLGATAGRAAGPNEVFRLQGALILLRKQESNGGSAESIVNHIGFRIHDLDAVLAECRKAGIEILTPDSFAKNRKGNVMGPDRVIVELMADPSLTVPVAFHHVHFLNSPVEDTRAWYVKNFGAVAGVRDKTIQMADVPGANLSFGASKTTPAPTKGRVFDHIGFEVKNLEEFCKKLEAAGVKFDQRYTKGPNARVAIAYIFDPWGTYIELTEGLGQ
jgi:extradiol dioxygenase family protein